MEHFSMTSLIVPGVIIALALVVLGMMVTVARNYHKVSPNTVAVISGRKYKYTGPDGKQQIRGYRVVTGGGFFQMPVLEKVDYLSLANMGIPVEVTNAPDSNGALITVSGVSQVKVLSDEATLALAIERFLGKQPGDIANTAKQTLEGSLRAIVGTMTIEGLIKDRQKLQQSVLAEAAADLGKLGLGIDVLAIQQITDARNYIESLGKKQTAMVVRDATIGEAEAHRDANIRSAAARQEGEVAVAQADQTISDAARARDTRIAENAATVQAQQARIPIVAGIAAAEETKKLNVARVEAEQARTEAETRRQELERKRHEAELNATTIVSAEKEREATLIAADAEQKAAVMTGEAGRVLAEKEGQGTQARQTAEAEGRKAAARANQAELEAQAAGDQAKLLAAAKGKEADLLAGAAGRKAELLAEAEGALQKARAFKELDQAGRFLLILEASPLAIRAFGEAIKEVMVPTAGAIGQGLANVDEIRLIDMGGSNPVSGGRNVLSQFASLPGETIFGIIQKMQAMGLGEALDQLAKKAGIDLSTILNNTSGTTDPTEGTKV